MASPSQQPQGPSVLQAPPSEPLAKRRKATLYDAVAGRVGYETFLRPAPPTASEPSRSARSARAVPADEVLFRRAHAPTRYAEDDIYHATTRNLPAAVTPLPASDLLKAVHAYAADFYARGIPDGGGGGGGARSLRSLDETALLAMGVLLEEAARKAVGETGDLAFVEAADDGDGRRDDVGAERVWIGGAWRRSVVRQETLRSTGEAEPTRKRTRSRSVRSGRASKRR